MIKKAKGFIIKASDFSESDKILTVFSLEFGKFSCIAKGARKLESGFGASLDLLNLSELIFYDGKNLKLLKEATIIESFSRLKRDYERLEVALRGARALNLLLEEGQADQQIFSLFQSLLAELNAGANDLRLLELGFKLKLVKISGYTPRFDRCCKCGQHLAHKNKLWFSAERGGAICQDCILRLRYAEAPADISIDQGIAKSLKAIIKLPLSKLARLSLTEEALNLSEKLLEEFIAYHIRPL